MFYTGWLLMLPLAGAVGAYLSKRAGGSLRMVLASSLFPVLPFIVVFLIAIPAGLAMGHGLVPAAYFTLGMQWVLLPGAALLAGGLLVELFISPRLTSCSIAGN
jgi:membrane protein YdbS with pleckstrin-like domain